MVQEKGLCACFGLVPAVFGVSASSRGPFTAGRVPLPQEPTALVLPCEPPSCPRGFCPPPRLCSPLIKVLCPLQFPSSANKTKPNPVLTACKLRYNEERNELIIIWEGLILLER